MAIDILVLLLAVSSFYRGRELGLARQLLAAVGFFGGLFLGAWLQPHAAKFASNTIDHTVITLSCTIGLAIVGLLLGEALGIVLKNKLALKKADHFDNYLGSGISIASLLVSAWLIASLLLTLPIPSLRDTIHESRVVGTLNKILPPAPKVMANLGKLIDPNGFPQVFIGFEPVPQGNINLPALGELRGAVEASRNAVVKVEGIGCGGIVNGSGFIVGDGLIATNAHVIAGIKQPYVSDRSGTYKAVPVWFDHELDFALLRAQSVTGKPLSLTSAIVPSGTAAVVLGYPGGGSLEADPAAVINTLNARGRDIYGQGVSTRNIYELRADIDQGNSGGPVLNAAGEVIGMVFAESTAHPEVGYALTSPQLVQYIDEAQRVNRTVPTGQCSAG